MPNQEETSQKHPRRSKRNAKSKGQSSSSSQTPSKAQFNTSHDEFSTTLAHPRQIEPSPNLAIPVDADGLSDADSVNPSTPSPSRSTQASSTTRDHGTSEPNRGAPDGGDGNKVQNAKQKAPSKPSRGNTSSTAARPNILPAGRVSETPSKAYAGPTFHASPAASSLPMPKFFSKSVPNVDKTSSLKSMTEPDVGETASENEKSPLINRTVPALGRQVREESPLDIFFQADRKAKASAYISSPANANPGGLSPYDTLRPDASPSRGSSRHHSRHPTDSSIGGVFDLEIGSPENASHTPRKTQPPAYDRSVSAPPSGVTEEQAREEQRQANTMALKNMLLLPQNQRPQILDPGSEHASANFGSPSPKPRQKRIPTTGAESRPSSSPGLASDASRVQRQAALRALAEKQIPSANGYTPQRPPASSLRKEMIVSRSAGQHDALEHPGTPTPICSHDTPPSANTRNQVRNRNTASDNGNFPILGLQALSLNSKQQREVAPSGSSPTTAAIENDLRRILKMDVLGNDGSSSVRS